MMERPKLPEPEFLLDAVRPVKIHSIRQIESYAREVAAWEMAELREHLNRLTGMKFSDRMHAALKSRAEAAESQLATAEARALERAAKIAAPYHTINGNDENGCPRFCCACNERRIIRDKIRALAKEST